MTGEGEKLGRRERDTRREDGRGRQAVTGEGDKQGRGAGYKLGGRER